MIGRFCCSIPGLTPPSFRLKAVTGGVSPLGTFLPPVEERGPIECQQCRAHHTLRGEAPWTTHPAVRNCRHRQSVGLGRRQGRWRRACSRSACVVTRAAAYRRAAIMPTSTTFSATPVWAVNSATVKETTAVARTSRSKSRSSRKPLRMFERYACSREPGHLFRWVYARPLTGMWEPRSGRERTTSGVRGDTAESGPSTCGCRLTRCRLQDFVDMRAGGS